jgi:adenine-specific DNA-methyltransferase
MKTTDLIKETGATFTPKELADYLSDKILSYLDDSADELNIVDPACGDGALLKSISSKINDDRTVSLTGYDTNIEYLNKASEGLKNFCSKNLTLNNKDFLDEIDIPNEKELDFLPEESLNNEFADIVIANPPYVRTQIMGAEKSQLLAEKFGLKGKVDLYFPFLISMTHALKENGIIGVITSNRYLVTKSGNIIRDFLYKNYDILEVIDLGDTKLFDAAVLPAIFIGRKKKSSNNQVAKFLKIYEFFDKRNDSEFKELNSIFEILKAVNHEYFSFGKKKFKKTSGIVRFADTKEKSWSLLTNSEAEWVRKLEKNSSCRVGDKLKVRVGIKTTADKVFISDDWERLGALMPEEDVLIDLISQENIQAWSTSDEKKLKVLYTHDSINDKNVVKPFTNQPKAMAYLESNSEVLKGRKYVEKAGKIWYEIWVPQKAHFWKYPKIVFPDISETPRFCIDKSGKIVNGNCYWIVAMNDADLNLLYLIQGIANSKIMTKYHDLVFGNKLYSGRRRYFSQYVQNYPLPSIDTDPAKKIIKISQKMNESVEVNLELLEELEKQVELSFRL